MTLNRSIISLIYIRIENYKSISKYSDRVIQLYIHNNKQENGQVNEQQIMVDMVEKNNSANWEHKYSKTYHVHKVNKPKASCDPHSFF